MKKLILSLALLISAGGVFAQELTKEEKAALKAAKKEAKLQLREATTLYDALMAKIKEQKATEDEIVAECKKGQAMMQKALSLNVLEKDDLSNAYRLSAEFAGKPHNILVAKASAKQPFDTVFFFDNLKVMAGSLDQELKTTEVKKGEYGNEKQLASKKTALEQSATHFIYAAQFESDCKRFERSMEAYDIALNYPKYYSSVDPNLELRVSKEQIAYYAYYNAFNAKKFDMMDKYYDQAIKFEQGAEGVKQAKIQAYLEKGDTASWAKYLHEITLADPVKNSDYIQMLLSYNQKLGKDKMVAYADEVLKVNPDILIANYGKAFALFSSEKYDEALVYYKKCSELKPDYYDAWYQCGLCKFRKALALNATVSSIKDQKQAKAALEQTKTLFGEAIPFFEKARECTPDEPQKWAYELKQCYTVTGQSAKAAEMDKLL